ncbi:MAG: hypothetical protein GTN62_12790 [Gemmatimonadales bacterium]|nr:hypothetical protein [Gemmatimonadales bacterium]NIN12687.1 hypothetical protein [Gemmatimonadales bacterium]NIN50966.1 hypothetical protein [Gemmatimonadales bacterium]NIP08430.1 hypothetical protein [Gemmatimonadales bacterium]NIR03613.1 hypothetical protein [Gemmatimonadales bacterium]
MALERCADPPIRQGSGTGRWGTARAAPGGCAGPPEVGRRRRVEEIIETWRIDDEWWREPITRRYVEVVLEGGGHVVLFEDLVTGQWFVQMP